MRADQRDDAFGFARDRQGFIEARLGQRGASRLAGGHRLRQRRLEGLARRRVLRLAPKLPAQAQQTPAIAAERAGKRVFRALGLDLSVH